MDVWVIEAWREKRFCLREIWHNRNAAKEAERDFRKLHFRVYIWNMMQEE